MRLLVLSLLTLRALGCSDGQVACPTGSQSVGICVPKDAVGEAACQEPPWRNIFASSDLRVESLIRNLTLDEKLSLLATIPVPGAVNYVERLGLPPPRTAECLHGVIATNFTVFPQSISLAATFDYNLLERIGTAIGMEMRAKANYESQHMPLSQQTLPICLGPQINIVRDPRWGRAQETYGEDPFLTGKLGQAYVRGMRGNHSRVLLVGAVAKHFDAYNGQTTRGSYSVSEVTLSEEDWAETFLPHWKVVAAEDVVGVMCSYNSLCIVKHYNESCSPPSHGVPACANRDLLQGVLRDDWRFDGFVMSDAGAVQFTETDHRYTQSQTEAASVAIKAGCDLDLGGGASEGQCRSFSCLGKAVDTGLVSETDVNRALSRQLQARVLTGTLDPPNHQPYANISVMDYVSTAAHRQLALEAARKSIVLLKNNGCLPMNPESMSLPGEMAVVGPTADKELFGNYNGVNAAVTILAGLRTRMPLISYHYGVNMTSPPSQGDVMAAVAAAANAEVTVAVMGLDVSQENEGGTRSDIVLPGWQSQFLDEIRANARTLVVILTGGSAIAVAWVQRNADAVLWVGYGGEEAGTAVADVLFGTVSPSGKLPMTWYYGLEQLPAYSSMDMRANPGRTYRFLTESPLYPFGFGLSYAKMEVALLFPVPSSLGRCNSLTFDASLYHEGGAPFAEEVVQVFVTRATPFRRSLGSFVRSRALSSGDREDLRFTVPASTFTVQHGRQAFWELGEVQVSLSLRGVDEKETSFSLQLVGDAGPCDSFETREDLNLFV